MNAMIWITTQRELLHKYPGAPREVAFLQFDHRHIFHFRVGLEIFHNERDVEFILFKRFIETHAISAIPFRSTWSCETMADMIAEIVHNKYPNRQITVEVSEDGENGIYKTYTDTNFH